MCTLNLPLMQVHCVVRKGPLSQRDEDTDGPPTEAPPMHRRVWHQHP